MGGVADNRNLPGSATMQCVPELGNDDRWFFCNSVCSGCVSTKNKGEDLLKKVCKKLLLRYGHAALALALFVGQLSVNVACKGDYYQPKVPKQLLKK